VTGLGAAVGFALAFLVIAWSAAALLSGGLAVFGARIARLGPAAERRIAALAVVAPVGLAGAVVTTLLLRSVFGPDHCQAHDHHAHLCLAHGAAWTERAAAIAIVAVAGVLVAGRFAILAAALVRARLACARLRKVATPRGDVFVVDSDRPFCFVGGVMHSRIYASSAAWEALDVEERAAMIAHERAHVCHRDVANRVLLEAVGAVVAPLRRASPLARWELATERLRDAEAAEVTGSPEAVASAMVHMCRLGASAPAGALATFVARQPALDVRVAALLDGAPTSTRAAVTAGRLAAVVAAGSALAIIALAEPLHHALESLLG
jgi:Zn-dependent protease with chaperone function